MKHQYLVYATRRAAAPPPQDGFVQYAPLGPVHTDAKTAFLKLLSAVERRRTREAGHGWDLPVTGLGWELWQVGFVPRPLAAATDADPVIVYRPHLPGLLGGGSSVHELHRWWADTVHTVTYRPATRATTVRTLTPATAVGTDPESETTA